MKLKRLHICNIASIEDATIDFTDSKIADHDMFLICGPTGSGKSTILDSICLALFDTTPRIAGSAKNVINIFANEAEAAVNNVNNVLHLVRKNAVEAAVTLDFIGSDDRLYTAKWRVYRKGQYRTSKKKVIVDGQECEVVETKTVTTFDKKTLEEKLSHEFKKEWTLTDEDNFDTIKDVASKIREVLKMNFDQFCKTTMLAQGDFTKFLQSTSDEKSDILEKLVGTDKYSKVGAVINKTANAKKYELDVMANELDNITFLSDEAKAAKAEEIAATNALIQQSAQLRKTVEDKLQWIEAYAQALADEKATRQDLEQAEQRLQSDQTKQQLNTVELWHKTESVRQALKTRANCKSASEQIEARKGQLAEAYDKVQSGTVHVAQRIDQLRQANDGLLQYLDSQKQYEVMYANCAVICETHSTVESDKRYVADSQPKLSALDQQLRQLNDEKQKLNDGKDAATQEIDILEKSVNTLKDQLTANGADSIDADLNALNSRDRKINELQAAHEQLGKLTNDYADKQRAADDAVAENDKYQAESVDANNRLEAAKTRLEESRSLYERTKDSISDHAKVLRSKLHKGDTCPVCGSMIDRELSDDSFIAALRPLEDKYNADKADFEAKTSEYSKAKAMATVHQKTVTSTAKAAQEAKAALKTARDDFDQKCQAIGIAADAYSDAISAVKQALEQDSEALKSRQDKIGKIRKDIDEINAQIAKIRKTRINTADKSLGKLQTNIDDAQKQKSQISGAVDKAKEAIDRSIKKLQELIDPEWTVPDGKDFYAELQHAADEYSKKVKQLNSNETSIDLMSQKLDMVYVCRKDIDAAYPQWQSRPKLEPAEIRDLSASWTSLQRDANALLLAAKSNEEASASSEKTIGDFTCAHPDIDITSVEALLRLDNADIDEMRSITDALKEERSNAKTLYESALKRKAALAECPLADDENVDTLNTLKLKLVEEEKERLLLVGRIQKELDADAENLRLKGQKKKQLDELREEYDQWETLNRYLGSTNGKNFRNVAQSFILNDLLDKANAYLENITGRYTLYCNPGTLTIMMRDAYQGGVSRPTNTLSGGESFIISLSLALGLSSMQNVDFEVDTLFIDEGFGTLSPEFIDPVITSLKRLYQVYHRRVGIISHVEMLRARIPVTIEVSRRGNSSSKITVS